jgi:hypothetical protein
LHGARSTDLIGRSGQIATPQRTEGEGAAYRGQRDPKPAEWRTSISRRSLSKASIERTARVGGVVVRSRERAYRVIKPRVIGNIVPFRRRYSALDLGRRTG